MTATDHDVARLLAEEAGAVLLALRAREGTEAADAEHGSGSALKDAGDRLSQLHLAARLAQLRPLDAVLSEEAKDDSSRVLAERVWIIDPLDGTREFAERSGDAWRSDWAVHVALWTRGSGLTAGAVALPARRQVLTAETVTPPDGRLIDEVIRGERPLRIAVSRSRPPAVVSQLASLIDVEFVPMGSAGVKAMAVVTGEVDAYLHAGGQYEWDSAAPVVVAAAAGLHTSRLDGSPLVYNRDSPWLPDLAICPAAIAPSLLDAVRRASAALPASSTDDRDRS